MDVDEAMEYGAAPTAPMAARVLAGEVARLRGLSATWEIAALAGLLVLGLDADTANRVGERIRELAGVPRA